MSEKGGERLTLREMRTNAKLLQETVALRMDVDQAAVSKWDTGETKPSRKYHKKLAKLYGVSVEELLDGIAETKAEREKKKQATYTA